MRTGIAQIARVWHRKPLTIPILCCSVSYVTPWPRLQSKLVSQWILVTLAASLIAETVRRPEFQPTPESVEAFQNLATTARVQAALITSPKTRNVVLNVKSDSGTVNISGILADPDLEKEIVRIAKGVAGVSEVVTDIEPPPIEYMHP